MSADPLEVTYTPRNVRVLAQTDPVPVLANRLGETLSTTQERLAALENGLRELDTLCAQLAGHGIAVDIDLGAVGNAARAARRDATATHVFDRGRT